MKLLDRIKKDKEVIKKLNGYKELYRYFVQLGMSGGSFFTKYKEALLEIGIDYDEKRAKQLCEEMKLRKYDNGVKLFLATSALDDRFAICAGNGKPVWVDYCFEKYRGRDNEEDLYNIEGTKKAIWLTEKLRQKERLNGLRLNLIINNDVEVDERIIVLLASRYKMYIEVMYTAKSDNPACENIKKDGYEKWDGNIEEITILKNEKRD